MNTDISGEPFTNFWSEPAPIRNQSQNRANRFRLLKAEYSKFRFLCDKGKTKWVRILPNTRNSQYPGQWILPHQVVYLPDNAAITDPRIFTGRTSPFFEFSLRIKRSADPQIASLYRSDKNENGIATWPRDMGIARAIEIPSDENEPPRLCILHLSMGDGTYGNSGVMHRIIELAQAVNDDPSQPREIRGTPKYPYSIVDPQHGRAIGLTRSNTYTVAIAQNEDFQTLNERLLQIAKQTEDPSTKEAIDMATKVGLESLLYPTTEEEAHELLQITYPKVYPQIFPERLTHQANGIPTPPPPSQPEPHRNPSHTHTNNPGTTPAKNLQEDAGNRPQVNPPHPGFADTIAATPNRFDPDQYPENQLKSPPAEPSDAFNDANEQDPDAILNDLLGEAPQHTQAALPYENKNKMAYDLNKLPKCDIGTPEYLTVKARLQVSTEIVNQLNPKHHATLKEMLGAQKYNDLFPRFA